MPACESENLYNLLLNLRRALPTFNTPPSTFRSDYDRFIDADPASFLALPRLPRFTIANQDKLNEFGERRAWRIHPSIGGGMHLTVKESTNLQKSNDFTTHGLYVTKQSDYEQASQHSKNANSPSEPIIKFGDYFNGESLEQEDLVVWCESSLGSISAAPC